MATAHLHMMLDELEMKSHEDLEKPDPVKILLDNSSAVAMGHSFKDTKHTRHIWRRYHYVRQGELSGMHTLEWIPKEYQLADIGTKPLTKVDLLPRLKFMMVDIEKEGGDGNNLVQEG